MVVADGPGENTHAGEGPAVIELPVHLRQALFIRTVEGAGAELGFHSYATVRNSGPYEFALAPLWRESAGEGGTALRRWSCRRS
jgi:hypothetical protein